MSKKDSVRVDQNVEDKKRNSGEAEPFSRILALGNLIKGSREKLGFQERIIILRQNLHDLDVESYGPFQAWEKSFKQWRPSSREEWEREWLRCKKEYGELAPKTRGCQKIFDQSKEALLLIRDFPQDDFKKVDEVGDALARFKMDVTLCQITFHQIKKGLARYYKETGESPLVRDVENKDVFEEESEEESESKFTPIPAPGKSPAKALGKNVVRVQQSGLNATK
jgi:hypothetical protein